MKTILLATICLICLTATAQEHYLPKFEIGIQGGPGVSFMRGPGVKKQKNSGAEMAPALCYSAGLTLQGNLKKFLGFRTGVMVQRMGYSIPFSGMGPNNDLSKMRYIAQFDYVDVPLMLQFHTGARTAFTIGLGGYAGALIRSNTMYKGIDSVATNPGGYQTFDAGIAASIGLRIPIAKVIILSLEARESVGLTPLSNTAAKSDRMYNNSLVVVLGIGFAVKRD